MKIWSFFMLKSKNKITSYILPTNYL